MHTTRIGPYEVERELGSGGMGAVYRVHRDGETYALKWVHAQIAAAPGVLDRFEREIAAGRAVDHANVVRTLDAGEEDGRPYLVMEYVEGRTLRQLLDSLGRLPEALLREVARQAAAGLVAIHDAGFVHRDIRPENILITDANEVRVMDLGVAKLQEASVLLTVAGQFAGSPLYASPEQVKASDDVDTATDLYSLGVVLHELATGRNPFAAPDLVAVLQNHLTVVPEPLDRIEDDVSAFFAAVVSRLLAKEIPDRLGTSCSLYEVLVQQEDSAWWAAHEAAVSDAARPQIPVGRETALVGRKAALEELHAAWQAAERGEAGLVLVEGEPGIGKTRLVDVFLAELDPSAAHLLYGAFQQTGGLGGVTEAFVEHFGASRVEGAVAGLLADTPSVGPALAARLRLEPPPAGAPNLTGETLHTALARLVQALAADRPVAWVVDDVQLAREEGRDLILALARALRGHRILLVLATHPGGIEVDADRHLSLSRLAPHDVQQLLVDTLRSEGLAARLAPRISERSDGIPLYALELLRGMESAGVLERTEDGAAVATGPVLSFPSPDSLRALIQGRLRDLTDEDRDLLEAAAVQGVSFDPGLLGEALDMKRVHVLRRLASIDRRAGIVRTQGDRYRFDVKQAQEVLLESLADSLRREYHTLYYEAGLARVADDPDGHDAEFLARHALAGTQPTQARRWLTPALAFLGVTYRLDEYFDLAHAALDVPDLVAGADRCRMLLDLAKYLDILARRDEQRSVLSQAARLAEGADDANLSVEVAYSEAVLLPKVGRFAEAEAALRDVVRRAHDVGDRALEGRAAGTLGTVLDNTGRHAEALEHLHAHLETARECADLESEMAAHCNLSLALLHLQRVDEAHAEMERHLALAQEIAHKRGEGIACGNLALIAAHRGHVEEARRLITRNIQLAREIGDRRSEAIVTYNLGVDDVQQGRLGDARTHLARAHTLAREIGDRRMQGLIESQQAVQLHYVGRLEEALDAMQRAHELLEATQNSVEAARVLQARAYVLFELGRGSKPTQGTGPFAERFLAAARGDADTALDDSGTGPISLFSKVLLLRDLYEATGASDHLDRARGIARTLIEGAADEDRAHAEAYYGKMLA